MKQKVSIVIQESRWYLLVNWMQNVITNKVENWEEFKPVIIESFGNVSETLFWLFKNFYFRTGLDGSLWENLWLPNVHRQTTYQADCTIYLVIKSYINLKKKFRKY